MKLISENVFILSSKFELQTTDRFNKIKCFPIVMSEHKSSESVHRCGSDHSNCKGTEDRQLGENSGENRGTLCRTTSE